MLIVPCISIAGSIDVNIKGVDDGRKTTKQQDYKEAVLFAKREAIERAGVKVKALTTARDFVVQSDYIESKAEAVLLPGYNIVDIGYQKDGTYLIILVGKVKTIVEGIESKELRYAKSLMDRGQKTKAERIITDIINNSKNDKVVAEAIYYQVVWQFAKDDRDTFEKLKAYYPDSKYVSRLEDVLRERKRERKRKKLAAFEAKYGRKIDSDGRFTLYSKGIVFDKKTGREWIAGPDRATIWSEAINWVKRLKIGGGGWRMPTLYELETLYEKGRGRNNLPPLLKTTGEFVWVDKVHKKSWSWGFDFGEGVRKKIVNFNPSIQRTRVFAVRSRR